jgi:hypothetical protein
VPNAGPRPTPKPVKQAAGEFAGVLSDQAWAVVEVEICAGDVGRSSAIPWGDDGLGGRKRRLVLGEAGKRALCARAGPWQ